MTHPNPKFEGIDPQTRALMWAIDQIINGDKKAEAPLKSLLQLARDLRRHANNYAFENGEMYADLKQAANYLEAMANND
jgi:predicted metal-dependent phosphoesterase TrpH